MIWPVTMIGTVISMILNAYMLDMGSAAALR